MPIAELGWSSLAEAEAYFTNERLETEHWDGLGTPDPRNKALNMAYNRIFYCPDYSVPVAGSETAAQKVKLIKIQAEMAYYIALHLSDEDRRKGLQAQAVIKAGIVKEDYYADWLGKLPIPPFVDALLKDFKTEAVMSLVDIDRDEDESVLTKVDDF